MPIQTHRRDDGGAAPSIPSAATSAPGPVTGPLLGSTGGRDDAIHTSVPDGAHIIPADVVGALGEGNSVAGAKKLSKMFPGAGPGIKGAKAAAPAPMKLSMAKIAPMPRMPHIASAGASRVGNLGKMPRMHKMPGMHFADGGEADNSVKVRLSDGEFSVPPGWVQHVGEGDQDRGHKALDAWIMMTRQNDIERRKRLPGPVQS